MITSLYIKNIAVVKEINLDFSNGFSVLTGETGAGKSVIIDSIGILLGSRPIKGKIRNGEQDAIVRACFEQLPEALINSLSELGFDATDGVMLQRSFNLDGKSVYKLNGQTITQSMAKDIGAHLITIHGQHDNQKLMQKSEHLDILDKYADTTEAKIDFQNLFYKYRSIAQRLESLKGNALEKARLYDIYRFQAEEIDSIQPRVGEEEKLLAEEKKLENLEKIQKHTKFSYHLIKGSEKGIISLLDKVTSSMSTLSTVLEEAQSITERLSQVQYEMEDIVDTIQTWDDSDNASAQKKLDKIGERLNAIGKLKKKYGNTIEDILEFRKKLAQSIDEMDNSDELIKSTETELTEIKQALAEKAEALSQSRKKTAIMLQNAIMNELSFLEMPKVNFIIDIKRLTDFNSCGYDDVEFLISANSGQEPMPMIKIASGGELSRIMLAIKSILLDKDGASSVIFDEIDTGISGKTARKVGIKLKHISKYMQVICVTHSAQIASLSNNHYLIYKHDHDGSTRTEIRVLDRDGKINEVARILGGLNITDNQILAAKEMIEEGTKL